MVSCEPILLPIGSIASSDPCVKSIMPTTSSADPARNTSMRSVPIGATVSESARTIATMGSTALRASLNFSAIFFLYN